MARKKTGKLPFVVQPRLKPIIETVGTEESGKIEIERRGYLTVGEKAFAQAVSSSDGSISELFTLVQSIAKESGNPSEVVFKDIQSNEGADYLDPYRERLTEKMLSLSAYEERHKLVGATALLVSRINSSWTAEDTMELHPDLIQGLYELYEDEEKKSLEAFATEEQGNKETSEGKE